VAIGAHNDHVGYAGQAEDHDSLRAFNRQAWTLAGAYAGLPPLSADKRAMIRVNTDSLRRIRPARRDSINNGADDDGSGSMAVLEIAENLARARTKPKRSLLFVWHTGEEKGLLGADWFTDHPTVSRDSIVAQINIDMIGRGDSVDVSGGGGPRYVGVVGHRRLSTMLGDMVDTVAKQQSISLDYRLDADGHPENIYCRSDHYMYARFGIPVAFFFTGLHGDYHEVTDEPQYIDYPHYTTITNYIKDVTVRVADGPRPVVDKTRPADPYGACRQ
jgi:Zn-dependent M28 family amino/carboxypeptidase